MIVYLARDIPAFVVYCVYGASCSFLLIDSTDSVIPLHGAWADPSMKGHDGQHPGFTIIKS